MTGIAWSVLAGALPVPGEPAPYEQVRPGFVHEFPRDHFEHPEFAAEWWYYTGNLATTEGRPFGFELTFFRVSNRDLREPETVWDASQVYLAHFVVTDIREGRFSHHERVNRRGPGLAGASLAESAIWNGNWRVDFLPGDPRRPTQRLRAGMARVSLELELVPAKPVVVHGRDGISRKAAGEGRASHYTSFTRLRASGSIRLGDSVHTVRGLAWMDHEFFSENLADDLAGWDWMSIQLEDGRDLMIYGLRGLDGLHGTFSGGTLVNTDGSHAALDAEDFRLTPGRTWHSRETGARYPVEWTVDLPALGLTLEVSPLLDDQEIVSESSLTPAYWEGAVRYTGQQDGRRVEGTGYLEMTGYDRPVVLLQ